MYSTDNVYPSPQPSYSDTYDWSQDTYFSPAPTPDPNPYIQTQSAPIPAYGASPPPAPAPAPPKEKRHKSRSRRHHEPPPPQQYPPPGYAPPPVQSQSQSQPAIPQPPTRVVRILTLLIEDKRQYHDEENENLLTEVRVPLRPADPGDVGMWADAQDVSEELQKGPSRIDGACSHAFYAFDMYMLIDGRSQAERRCTRCGASTSSTSCGRLRTGRTCASRRT